MHLVLFLCNVLHQGFTIDEGNVLASGQKCAYRGLGNDVDDVAFGRAGLIDRVRRAVKIGLRLGLEPGDAVC